MSRSLAGVRAEFPIFKRSFHGHSLAYLDSAATTLKPEVVVKRISDYYLLESANVHRGAYALSDEATQTFENARTHIAKFIGAEADEIIFTRNATEAINLVAGSWGFANLKKDDAILLTEMEHHGNIVPWQILSERLGLKIEVVRILDNGLLDEEDLQKKLKAPVKLFALTGCSNTFGTINDLQKITAQAHAQGITVLGDVAQLVSQKKIDVRALDIDFLAFSGHKIFGPTGIGVLFGKAQLLKEMPPYQGGGSMISSVTFEKTTYNDAPFRFEAGTPHIEGAIGLHSALEWFSGFNFEELHKMEMQLLEKATRGLQEMKGVTLYGVNNSKGAILSFNLEGHHHSDVAQILDQQGVAVRAGHHCTQPLMKRLGVPGTVRASFSIYNTEDDVQRLLSAVQKAKEMLS